MAIELTIPSVGESITEVQIGDWRKAPGDAVEKDEVLLTIESEKATIDLPAPAAGTLSRITKQKGEVAKVGDVVGSLDPAGPANPQAPPAAKPVGEKSSPAAKPPDAPVKQQEAAEQQQAEVKQETRVMPAARQALAEHSIDASAVKPTGPGGRLLKEDVLRAAGEKSAPLKPAPATMADRSQATAARGDEIVPMTPLRRTVARRLVEAQQSMAMLTTFNEIDMSGLMTLRKSQQEAFQEKHKVKLGLMSFFIKATVDALGGVPQLNAEVRGTDIVYHRYYDIGVAIGGGKGLVVPVLRNAERLGFAQIELAIEDFARRAKENHLKPDELQGGTFTISNGGVYGSLMSTPIVNPPQSGILGLHTIKDRPVAVEGQVVVRPMMYVALSYDHRIVDGREAVMFLKRIKDIIENPVRLLLDL